MCDMKCAVSSNEWKVIGNNNSDYNCSDDTPEKFEEPVTRN